MEGILEKGIAAVQTFIEKMPKAYDITSKQEHILSIQAAEALITALETSTNIEKFEKEVFPQLKEKPVGLHLTIKLAISKTKMQSLPPFHLSVVFAMYNEHNRLKTKEEHPAGEDFLREKVKEMEWLFEESKDKTWDIMAIDDGCPNSSGKLCEEIISKDSLANTRVIYLQEAIDSKDKDFADLNSTKDSQKGGAIQYGLKRAMVDTKLEKKHIVMYTDADISANLALSGLLAAPILLEGKQVSVGDRYMRGANYATHVGGFALEQQDIVNLTLRAWIRGSILPPLKGIADTQCGMKAVDSKALEKLFPLLKDRKFSFDMELLIKSAQTLGDNPFAVVPIVFIESMAESNFYSGQETSLEVSAQSYFKMIARMCEMSVNIFPDHPKVDKALLKYFTELKFPDYFKITQKLMEHVNELHIGEFEATIAEMNAHL